MAVPLDREAVVAAYRRDCAELEVTLAAASADALEPRSAATRWTNEELLHHMVFAYPRLLSSVLERRLRRETEPGLSRRMYFPPRWDPFFKEAMTLTEVNAYPVSHFAFHPAQLSLDAVPGARRGCRK